MFDIAFTELLLIGVVALLVLGPERLPRAARMAGLWMRRARASWYSLRGELERELADEDLRRSLKAGADDLSDLQRELSESGRSIARGISAEGAMPADALGKDDDSAASGGGNFPAADASEDAAPPKSAP